MLITFCMRFASFFMTLTCFGMLWEAYWLVLAACEVALLMGHRELFSALRPEPAGRGLRRPGEAGAGGAPPLGLPGHRAEGVARAALRALLGRLRRAVHGEGHQGLEGLGESVAGLSQRGEGAKSSLIRRKEKARWTRPGALQEQADRRSGCLGDEMRESRACRFFANLELPIRGKKETRRLGPVLSRAMAQQAEFHHSVALFIVFF